MGFHMKIPLSQRFYSASWTIIAVIIWFSLTGFQCFFKDFKQFATYKVFNSLFISLHGILSGWLNTFTKRKWLIFVLANFNFGYCPLGFLSCGVYVQYYGWGFCHMGLLSHVVCVLWGFYPRGYVPGVSVPWGLCLNTISLTISGFWILILFLSTF